MSNWHRCEPVVDLRESLSVPGTFSRCSINVRVESARETSIQLDLAP